MLILSFTFERYLGAADVFLSKPTVIKRSAVECWITSLNGPWSIGFSPSISVYLKILFLSLPIITICDNGLILLPSFMTVLMKPCNIWECYIFSFAVEKETWIAAFFFRSASVFSTALKLVLQFEIKIGLDWKTCFDAIWRMCARVGMLWISWLMWRLVFLPSKPASRKVCSILSKRCYDNKKQDSDFCKLFNLNRIAGKIWEWNQFYFVAHAL
jgi:hypothetical protein